MLYKVKATYKYTQEDVDELSFDVGEIIRVVEYDDPEEQVSCGYDLVWYFHDYGANPVWILGRRMADGSQRNNRWKRNVPSELHQTFINKILLY